MMGNDATQKQEIKQHFRTRSLTYVRDNYEGKKHYSRQFVFRREVFVAAINSYYQCETPLLDLGCGPGVLIEYAVKYGWDYIGLDLSLYNLRTANGGAKMVNGDMEKLPFKNDVFSFISAMGAIEYVPNWRQCVREMIRVVKPGGFILVSLPNKYSPYRWWSELVYNPLSGLAKQILNMEVYRYKRKLFSKKEFIDAFTCPVNVQMILFINAKLILQPIDRMLSAVDQLITERLDSKKWTLTTIFGTEIIVLLQVK